MSSAAAQLVLAPLRKLCGKCGADKPIGDFHHDRYRPDGHTDSCGECRMRAANGRRQPTNRPERKHHFKTGCASCESGLKWCPACQRHLAMAAFMSDRSRVDGKYGWCADCNKAKCRQAPAAPAPCVICGTLFAPTGNRQATVCSDGCKAERARRSRREYVRREVYGITTAEYEALRAAQGGRCAICGAISTGCGAAAELFVDHDHATGAIRGLLCHGCNSALGLMGDDAARLRNAAAYIEAHVA